jgi:hypothetical protein
MLVRIKRSDPLSRMVKSRREVFAAPARICTPPPSMAFLCKKTVGKEIEELSFIGEEYADK